MKNLRLASTSSLHGSGYLEYLFPELLEFFSGCNKILFIPYARPGGITHDEYTQKVAEAFVKIGKDCKGIHEYANAKEAIKNAEAIFVGGGNTFTLVNELYSNDLMQSLKEKLDLGTPYLGTSAGSNIAGLTMQTTNDMPIVKVKSYETLGFLPFNINAHFLDSDPNSTHKGETREQRIMEFHAYSSTPVLGLREGSWLEVKGNHVSLKGGLSARLFRKGESPIEIASDHNIEI